MEIFGYFTAADQTTPAAATPEKAAVRVTKKQQQIIDLAAVVNCLYRGSRDGRSSSKVFRLHRRLRALSRRRRR